jgi:hypothetical protein
MSIINKQFNTPVFLPPFIRGVRSDALCATKSGSLKSLDIYVLANQIFRHSIGTLLG